MINRTFYAGQWGSLALPRDNIGGNQWGKYSSTTTHWIYHMLAPSRRVSIYCHCCDCVTLMPSYETLPSIRPIYSIKTSYKCKRCTHSIWRTHFPTIIILWIGHFLEFGHYQVEDKVRMVEISMTVIFWAFLQTTAKTKTLTAKKEWPMKLWRIIIYLWW